MADSVVKDYLGHPCRVTEALAYFSEAVDEARTAAKTEPRAIARSVGASLLDISARCTRIYDGLDAVLHLLPNDTDSDRARAVLEMLLASATDLSTEVWNHAGAALVALEVGHLLPGLAATKQEVTHG